MYDIAIIGAGPAGATLARLVADRYKVLLIDKRRLMGRASDPWHQKCCGGLLAPDAQKVLSQFGLGLPRQVLVDPQIFVVRAIDQVHSLERYYQRFYVNLDRYRFDCWLLSMVPTSVDTWLGMRFIAFDPIDGGYRIQFQQKGKRFKESAKVIIGADGAASRVRRMIAGQKPSPQKYIAIQEWIETTDVVPYFSTFFDQTITDFYGWTIPKGDMILVGAALSPQKDVVKKFNQLKRGLTRRGMRLGRTIAREGAVINRPTSINQIYTGAGGAALLGEAAGWISPSSAEGFSYAFKSARCLAQALDQGLAGFNSRYARNTRNLRLKIVLKNLKSPFMYNNLLRKMILRSGINSVTVN
jgi:flavin-dependent dehydrogenase